MPSRFLPLVAGVSSFGASLPSPGDGGLPATPIEAEAWLRRLVRDPAEPEPRRLAALGALGGSGAWKHREPTRFAGILPRGSDDGLVPPGGSLSPSQADAYLSCPRLYAFRRRLHVDADGSVYLEFGSLIHAVLEAVEGAAKDRGEAHATLAEALAALADLFDPGPFGGGGWADAWYRKAERILTHLYEAWPSTGRVVDVERGVEMEIDGSRWRGRVDRLEVEERPDGPPLIRIVDYKTGSSAVSADDAATSVQLGFYLLAARNDPGLSAIGEIGAAEFWFPAVKQKSVAVRNLVPERLGDVEALMAAAAAGIAVEDWTPNPGPGCDRCPVRGVCPEWPEGREAYQG